MGRVARYKKVKAFDPYSSKNGGRLDADTVGVWGLGESGRKAKKRSRTSQKLRTLRKKNPLGAGADFDVAPERDDFDLADLVGSLKREKNPLDEEDMKQQPYVPPKLATNKTATAAPSQANKTATADPEEKEQAKLLKKVQQQVSTKLTEPKFEDRRPGESKRAYNRRVKLETRQIIQKERQMEHNPLKRQKKKDFLNSKKKKQKRSRGAAFDQGDDDSNAIDERAEQAEGKLLTGEQAVAARARATQVHFGEQAERPPVFHQLPRGARKQSKGQSNNKDASKTNSSGGGGMKEEEIEAERQAVDLMRRKVQAQYAAIKAKRKQAGDFHL